MRRWCQIRAPDLYFPNDSLHRISIPFATGNIASYSTRMMSDILSPRMTTERMRSLTTFKGRTGLKPCLLLPIYRTGQWALLVVVNPAMSADAPSKMYLLDPLGSKSVFDPDIIQRRVTWWLNMMRMEQGSSRPQVSAMSTKLFVPSGELLRLVSEGW